MRQRAIDRDDPQITGAMTDLVGSGAVAVALVCRVYWGSHGCDLQRGHDGPHRCDCCTCVDHDRDALFGATDPEDEGVLCVAKPPYYGPDTHFYGEDT